MIHKIVVTTWWLWIFYFLLSTSFNPSFIIIGIISVLIITYISYYFLGKTIISVKWTPKRLILWIQYLFSALKEIIKANIDVAERVLDPKLPINPSIVKIKVPFKNPFLLTLLANTITLTPGTLSVDHKGEYIYVHFLAEEHIESLSQRNLSGKILKVFGNSYNNKIEQCKEGVRGG